VCWLNAARRAGSGSSYVMPWPESFATVDEVEQAIRIATAQLNLRAKPRVWGTTSQDTRALAPPLLAFKESRRRESNISTLYSTFPVLSQLNPFKRFP